MKIFLYGDIDSNAGPSNVNRTLVEHADESLIYKSSHHKFCGKFETLLKIMCSDVIIMSGIFPLKNQRILKVIHPRAKIIYLMHGNLEYENTVNHLNLTAESIRAESEMLKSCNAIVCVSKKYAQWVGRKYPQYLHKIDYVNNGLTIAPRPEVAKKPLTIAVAGGNRCIKNNLDVCRAVEKLIQKGFPCELYIFGRQYPDNDDFSEYPFAKIMGHMTQEEFYTCLDGISLFVVASEVESFSLVVGDALNCHCSLLLSDNTGAAGILDVTEEDCLHNPHDMDEFCRKLEYALLHPNSDRLLNSIDPDMCSAEESYRRLKKICEEVEMQ